MPWLCTGTVERCSPRARKWNSPDVRFWHVYEPLVLSATCHHALYNCDRASGISLRRVRLCFPVVRCGLVGAAPNILDVARAILGQFRSGKRVV